MPSLYLETTIPSYLAARPCRDVVVLGHQESTREWWATERRAYDIYVSQLVLDEVAAGDPVVSAARLALVDGFGILDLTSVVEDLAIEYAEVLAIPERAVTDAYHLAFAVEYEMDYLLTWNCSHLANGVVRRKLQGLNLSASRHIPMIVTPEELISPQDA